jgi:hypothetical protein
MIGPAIGRVGPNHSSAVAVRLGDYGIVGNVNPSAESRSVCRVMSPRIIHIPLSGGDRKAAALDQGEDLVFPCDDAGKRVRLG